MVLQGLQSFYVLFRYVYMTKPLRYETLFTPFRGTIAILAVWLFVCTQTICLLLFTTTVNINRPCRMISAVTLPAISVSMLQVCLHPLTTQNYQPSKANPTDAPSPATWIQFPFSYKVLRELFIISYRQGGLSVCDDQSSTFSGPPLTYSEKF